MQPKDCEFWISVTIALYALKVLFLWSVMNVFPVIGDPVMCTGFGISRGANIASRLKELHTLKFFSPLKAILYLTQEGVLIKRIYRINHTETYNLSTATLVTFALHKILTKMHYSFPSYWKIIHLFGRIKNWLWSNLNSSPNKLMLFTKSENYFPRMSFWRTD